MIDRFLQAKILPVNFSTSIVIPVHNRSATTARCLENLASDNVLNWAEVIVVDDGSVDGTSDCVARNWPRVRILHGDGGLWWAGAMQLGMDHINPASDVVIWLNDDCRPKPGVLEKMIRHVFANGEVVVARSITTQGFVYGGWIRTVWGLRPAEHRQYQKYRVDSFGGNCVAFPKRAIEQVGPLEVKHLFHNYADADYALRIKAAGIDSVVIPEAMCDSDHNENPQLGSWLESSLCYRDLLRGMQSPKSMLYWPSRRFFFQRHWGSVRGFIIASLPYVRFVAFALGASLFGRSRLIAFRNNLRGRRINPHRH